jgi:hypothetical protein
LSYAALVFATAEADDAARVVNLLDADVYHPAVAPTWAVTWRRSPASLSARPSSRLNAPRRSRPAGAAGRRRRHDYVVDEGVERFSLHGVDPQPNITQVGRNW